MNDLPPHHAPNLGVIAYGYRDAGAVWVFWLKLKTILGLQQTFHEKFRAEGGNHNLPVGLFLQAIHD
tara:strand:+ start:101 stop:301 length:201 start_codon:yes stop_codon:yes gene_type:complete